MMWVKRLLFGIKMKREFGIEYFKMPKKYKLLIYDDFYELNYNKFLERYSVKSNRIKLVKDGKYEVVEKLSRREIKERSKAFDRLNKQEIEIDKIKKGE